MLVALLGASLASCTDRISIDASGTSAASSTGTPASGTSGSTAGSFTGGIDGEDTISVLTYGIDGDDTNGSLTSVVEGTNTTSDFATITTSDDSTTGGSTGTCSVIQSPESVTEWDHYCGWECQALIYAQSGSPSSVTLSFATDPATPVPVTFRMLAAVDDHDENALPYTLDVTVDDQVVADDVELVGVPHGSPLGGPFGNLTIWEIPLPEGLGGAGGETRFVTLSDLDCGDCDSGDWLVIDWSEMDACAEG